MKYFVTGIDTDSGKTLTSAILCESLEADYWKPVQAGTPTDTDVVKSLVSNSKTKFYPEFYKLKTPSSPHAAGKVEGINLSIKEINIPETQNNLIIEGAGGCLVPLNDHEFVIDMINHFKAAAILVADLYLGSINHTLLSLEALQKRNVTVKGIIFNGESNPESERIILLHSKLKCLLHIKKERSVNSAIVKHYAHQLRVNWND
jgi:dethiobiotin synthetase